MALPDEVSQYSWQDVLTGVPIDGSSRLALDELPLPWAVLKSTNAPPAAQ